MDIVKSSLEGLTRAEASLSRSADRIAKLPLYSLSGQPVDVVDLSAEAVAMMEARNLFQANIKAAQTGDEIAKSTLDLLG